MKTGPNVRKRADGRFEARYEKGRKENGRIEYGFCYGTTYDEAFVKRYRLMSELGLHVPDRYVVLADPQQEVLELPKVRLTKDGYIEGSDYELNEDQALLLDRVLHIEPDTHKAAVFLCLHMGLSIKEVNSIRFGDFDFQNRLLKIGNGSEAVSERTMPLPSHVIRYFKSISDFYATPDCYITTGRSDEAPSDFLIFNAFKGINGLYKISRKLSCTMLQNTFVRRLLQSNIGIYTVCELGNFKSVDLLMKKFRRYVKSTPQDIERLARYSVDYEPDILPITESGKRMNLLILGAGGEGNVVKEIAISMGIFKKISFLDDRKKGPDIIGTFEEASKFVDEYPIAIAAIGLNAFREQLTDRLEKLGYIMPLIISPSASISPSAKLTAPCIVEAKAIIGPEVTAKRGCIISSASMIDRESELGEFVHIDVTTLVNRHSIIPDRAKIESGTIYNKAKPED